MGLAAGLTAAFAAEPTAGLAAGLMAELTPGLTIGADEPGTTGAATPLSAGPRRWRRCP